jgi:ComF family protein
LVHALKYNGKVQLARPFGLILGRVFDTFWSRDDFDLIIPVPLHRRRMKARGFNQVGLMMRQWARCIEKEAQTPAPIFPHWIGMQRVLPTQPQTGLGRKDRPLNLRNAFGLKRGTDISGLKLLLVDDVYTTGATANEGARMLRQHGAGRVDVLTLARA